MPNNTDNKDGSPNTQAPRSPGLLNPLDPTRLTIAGSPRPTPAECAAMRKGRRRGGPPSWGGLRRHDRTCAGSASPGPGRSPAGSGSFSTSSETARRCRRYRRLTVRTADTTRGGGRQSTGSDLGESEEPAPGGPRARAENIDVCSGETPSDTARMRDHLQAADEELSGLLRSFLDELADRGDADEDSQ